MFLDAEFFAGVEGFDLAGALVAVTLVPGEEFVAGGDDGDMDVGAVMATGVVVGGGEELFADAGVLVGREDAEKAEVEPGAFFLKIDTAEDGIVGAGVFEDDGTGDLEQLFDAGGVCARAGEEVGFMGPALLPVFCAVGAVDEGYEGGDVVWGSGGDDGDRSILHGQHFGEDTPSGVRGDRGGRRARDRGGCGGGI